MSTAATSNPERNAAEVADLVLSFDQATPEVVARRMWQRRQMCIGQVASYSLGASVLLLYACDGAIPTIVPSLFWLGGLMIIGSFAVLSEAGVAERYKDHYLTVFQITAHMTLQLIFMLAVPAIGIAFISVPFLVFAFGTLRMTSQQATLAWTLATIGLGFVLLNSDLPIGMPVTSRLERIASMLCFVLVIDQCAFLGLFGSTLRKILYRRSIELKAAYQRIEELAERDELTGSLNRRSIMRALDDEIAGAREAKAPCSAALIDLDWFKRINDAHGHPTGDEVLRTFAITIFANIGPNDRFGRYGGEESCC
jgi:diguanylate cyclase